MKQVFKGEAMTRTKTVNRIIKTFLKSRQAIPCFLKRFQPCRCKILSQCFEIFIGTYTAKLRYLAQKLVEPTLAPEKEPLSGAGIGFSVALVVMTLCLIGLMGAACWLFQQG